MSALTSFAGLTLDQPRLMGVVNVTPDSFSDGGDFIDAKIAIEHGRFMAEQGADILDIGGESTRPGAAPVEAEEELDRVIPVIEGLRGTSAVLSIDTRRAVVMRRAIKAGASIVNDVTGLAGDPESLSVCAQHDVDVVIMHMQGEPQTMQDNPTYDDASKDVFDYLLSRVYEATRAGIPRHRIAVDPGIGFGKSLEHNLRILSDLKRYAEAGLPVLLGVSRKSFIAKIDGDGPAKDRVAGSVSAALGAYEQGVRLFRVHDVPETRQALAVWRAISAV